MLRFVASPAGRALIALALVILLGVIFHADGAFFKIGTHRDALRQASVFGILACGMTLVIITGGIDLAVGSVLALAAVVFATFTIHWGWTAWLAVPLVVLLGASCGAISGSLTAWFRIQPFIATLAMMVFARGLAKIASGGMKVSTAVPNDDGTYSYIPVPGVFRLIDSRVGDVLESWCGAFSEYLLSRIGGWFGDGLAWVFDAVEWIYVNCGIAFVCANVSVVTVIFLFCVALAWLLLARHRWGRQLYAIGGNEEAARLSGVPVRRAKIMAYAAAGLLAGVAGICQAAQEQQGDPEAGMAYELSAIAIVVIGGTNLMGGRGGIGLTLIGTLTIGYLEKVLSINAVPEASRLMLTGVIIVLAVLTQKRRR
ncbi:MAG: ABC transporter permease [Phycisphaerales bacterium]|nr:MAG: ABC transporter permease [Phycisphaerales bacterium]